MKQEVNSCYVYLGRSAKMWKQSIGKNIQGFLWGAHRLWFQAKYIIELFNS